MRRLGSALLAAGKSIALSLLFFVALGVQAQTGSTSSTAETKVKIVTSEGDIVVELYPDKAPKTVENFLQYVNDKHYDGTIFHRVIRSYMIQGGGYQLNFVEKKARAPIAHEGRDALAKGLKNTRGTLAMSRTNDPQSASAQFFINTVDNAFLDPIFIPEGDPVRRFEYQGRVYENVSRANLLNATQLWGYTVFGKVIEGMDVVDKIGLTVTGSGGPFATDVPKTAVTIASATLVHTSALRQADDPRVRGRSARGG